MRCATVLSGMIVLLGLGGLSADKSPSPQKEKVKTRAITLAIEGMT